MCVTVGRKLLVAVAILAVLIVTAARQASGHQSDVSRSTAHAGTVEAGDYVNDGESGSAGGARRSGDPKDRRVKRNQAHNQWMNLAPSLPAENEIECYVEFATTEMRGGRCTQLANQGPYICQSGVNIDFQPSCASVVAARHEQALGSANDHH